MSWFELLQRRAFWLFGVYLLLLFASGAVRFAREAKPLPADKKAAMVFAVKNDEQLENQPIRFAYQEFLPQQNTNRTPVFLLHGSPGDGSVLIELARELSAARRVIVPDLPGFGDSTRSLPDYSFRAHAFYLRQLADQLGIEKFHVLGFSMGSGVVLSLSDFAPERLVSITMISAIGVQEYELLGDYYLNRILHGAQLGAIWGAAELLPHFGLLDRFVFGVPYARNFFDSDQRPLRAVLQTVETPFLIVHGAQDSLVPVVAAREHARLVPHSEYTELDDNHFMVFMRPALVAPVVADFLGRVDDGAAKSKANADQKRINAAAKPFRREMVMADGAASIVFFGALVLATFISDDLTVLLAGALAGQGRISLTLAVFACFVGVYAGDLLIFFAGRFFGRRAVRRAPLRWLISESRFDQANRWLEKNGFSAIFVSRFIPALRLPLYFAAGTAKTNSWAYALFSLIADAVYVPLLVGATWYFSRGMMAMMNLPAFTGNFWLGMIVFVGAAFLTLNLSVRLATWRGRRMLVGTFKRWTQWEFWSLRTFYFPVVIYIFWLAVKHRSLSVFADANPALEAGGFVGESKQQIYKGLRQSPDAEPHLLRYVFLSKDLSRAEKSTAANDFLRENNLNFPVAFKPNQGERGAGVFLVKTVEELNTRIKSAKTDLILQEFAPGDEFSVFYYRYPNDAQGKIFSITEKRFPVVTGDGKATLETLILRDSRAVALANSYFERNRDNLDSILARGEIVSIIDIGTHSKGAIFLDGGWAKTAALENKIDQICRGYTGFYFGRFDLRRTSVEDFKRGANFKIIELNGVTSEATNIYDPKNSLAAAYRTLFKQWRIAFEIGGQNRARGVRPTGWRTLVKLLWKNWFGKSNKSKSATHLTNSDSPTAIEN